MCSSDLVDAVDETDEVTLEVWEEVRVLVTVDEPVDDPVVVTDDVAVRESVVVVKLIRFGQQGADNKPPRKNETQADKAKRAAFKKRHAKNIAKGKMSAAFWSDKVKW
mgnify:CR=1 FL=1